MVYQCQKCGAKLDRYETVGILTQSSIDSKYQMRLQIRDYIILCVDCYKPKIAEFEEKKDEKNNN